MKTKLKVGLGKYSAFVEVPLSESCTQVVRRVLKNIHILCSYLLASKNQSPFNYSGGISRIVSVQRNGDLFRVFSPCLCCRCLNNIPFCWPLLQHFKILAVLFMTIAVSIYLDCSHWDFQIWYIWKIIYHNIYTILHIHIHGRTRLIIGMH